MNFYSTYYRNHATPEQTKVMKELFDSFDENGDKALNKDELANIFTSQTFTEAEKDILMQGSDKDDDGFLVYTEFSPAFLEFDVDDSANITAEEGTLIRTKLNELNKEQEILAQYGIINNLTSTDAQKAAAREEVELLNAERMLTHSDAKIQEKQIVISSNVAKAQEIQDYVDTSTLLEFERVQKLKDADAFLAENELLSRELNILVAERDVRNLEKEIIENQRDIEEETDPAEREQLIITSYVLQAQKNGAESQKNVAENNLELYNNSLQIDVNEKMLTKFFIPELYKENARKELEGLYDNKQLLDQKNEMYDKVSQLCAKRELTAALWYQLDITPDTPENASIRQDLQDQIDQEEALLVLEATIETKKTDLANKQIQLKAATALASHGSVFVSKKEAIEAEIAELQQQIAELEAQLL